MSGLHRPNPARSLRAAPETAPVRVLLLDDRFLSRRGMEIVLSAEDGIEVVGASDRQAGLAGAVGLAPDVVLLEPGPDTYRQVREALPGARILMLGSVADGPAVDHGDGAIDRRLSGEELACEIRRVGADHPRTR